VAYPYDGMFYPTLPEDTQDFGQVLSGVGRNLRDVGRGISYFPMDLAGAAADIGNLPLQGIDYLVNQIRGTDQNYLSTERPFGGSAQLIDVATKLGLSQQPTGSAPETIGRVMAGLINPMAGARAVGRVGDITTEQANRAADALVRQITGNPTATAPQVLQETSMPFMQAVAPRPSGLLETPVKSDLGFYSALEQATIPLQNKGTGSQFLAQIEKTAGVKPEEVKWTGLDEFLKSRQNVTKQEVQDYLAANRVDLQEVRLGGPEAFNEQRLTQLLDELAGLRQHPIDDPNFGEEKYNEMIRLMNIRDQSTTSDLYRQADQAMKYGQQAQARGDKTIAEGFFRQYELLNTRAEKLDLEDLGMQNPPKFSSYTLPGGENYREILLTLPAAKAFDKTSPAMKQMASEMYGANNVGRLSEGQWEIVAKKAQGTLGQEFKSSHFDQPNILAHMRVNDRVVDGKKTLFIEEVQSDWHQAGRKKGYDTPEAKAAEQQKLNNIIAERQSLSDEKSRLEKLIIDDTNQGKDTPSDIIGRFSALGNRLGELQRERYKIEKNFGQGVPDAPFKTTWHELSLKRAIQEASEKGYDQIAFTTGKTQAERYDLSKQVDSLLYTKNPNGTYRVSAQVQGQGRMLGESIPESDLADYVGKEVAEKMAKGTGNRTEVAGQYDPVSMTSSRGYMTELSGEGLKVGGEGMKGFYDQILPKSLEKLGKKFNAKVGKTNMDGTEVWKMDITPQMRESVLTKGQPLFAATPAGLGLLGSEEE